MLGAAQLPEPERIEVPVSYAFGPYRSLFPRGAVAHPAKANVHLVERLIELLTAPGDLVLDPFAGTFSTCVVAVLKRREAVGVEINPEYCSWGVEAARRASAQAGRGFGIIQGDAALVGDLLRGSSADSVATSPPYVLSSLHAGDPSKRLGRVLRAGADPREFFGGLARNAMRESSHRYDYYSLGRWIALMRAVLSGLCHTLRSGSLAAFIVRNRLRRGSLLELDSLLASLAREAGFSVEALYVAPAPRSLWANLLSRRGIELPREDRVVVLRR